MNGMSCRQRATKLKTIYYVWVIIFLMTSVVGCGNYAAVNSTPASGEIQTITDCFGRTVQVPVNPQRIACLCPEAGHALAMYDKGDAIVAIVNGMRRDKLLVEMYPHITKVPVPKSSGVINIEDLVAANPDLVLVKADVINHDGEMEKLAKAGIPVVGIQFSNMQEQLEAMRVIAQAVGTEVTWQKYREFYESTVALVQDRVAGIPDGERIRIYHSVNEATRTDPKDSLPADWTRAAGVVNVSINEDLKYEDGDYYASLEQILLWDPDYILVNDPNVVGYIMENEQWAPLQAVKNGNVLPMPNGLSRWGHFSSLETPLAVLWTAKTVYPERFEDIDMKTITRDFYKQFFNWDLDDATIDNILSSRDMRGAKNQPND